MNLVLALQIAMSVAEECDLLRQKNDTLLDKHRNLEESLVKHREECERMRSMLAATLVNNNIDEDREFRSRMHNVEEGTKRLQLELENATKRTTVIEESNATLSAQCRNLQLERDSAEQDAQKLRDEQVLMQQELTQARTTLGEAMEQGDKYLLEWTRSQSEVQELVIRFDDTHAQLLENQKQVAHLSQRNVTLAEEKLTLQNSNIALHEELEHLRQIARTEPATKQSNDQETQTEAVLMATNRPVVQNPGPSNGAASQNAKAGSSTQNVARNPVPENADSSSAKFALSDCTDLLSAIPAARQSRLQQFDEIVVNPPAGAEGVYFTRFSLSKVLGGNLQPLIVSIGNTRSQLAYRRNVTKFLCPNLDHNPWLPTRPGTHGYMQVGLGTERSTFTTPEFLHVFVGAKSKFFYMGKYEVSRVDPLTQEEWANLPEKIKVEYSKTTGHKEKHYAHGSEAQIHAKYDRGELRAPCVMLKCIEFDPEFFSELIETNKTFIPAASPKNEKQSSASHISLKRSRSSASLSTQSPVSRKSTRIENKASNASGSGEGIRSLDNNDKTA